MLPNIGPALTILRRSRLERYFFTTRACLPAMEYDLMAGCDDLSCAAQAHALGHAYGHYARKRRDGRPGRWRPLAMAIDLESFPTNQDYLKAVSRETQGKYRRSANRALRGGCRAMRIEFDADYAGRREILQSAPMRSRGVVLDAILRPMAPAQPTELVLPPLRSVACQQHWRARFGVFAPTSEGERMVADAILRRSGPVVSIDFFMGHSNWLREGVTKLLMFEIMEWLLERREPMVRGLRHCLQDGLEDGAEGLMDWKRYTQFKPCLLGLTGENRFPFPADFNDREYLALHPDVAKAGIPARTHYMFHGVHEGRAWRKSS